LLSDNDKNLNNPAVERKILKSNQTTIIGYLKYITYTNKD